MFKPADLNIGSEKQYEGSSIAIASPGFNKH